eukprot:CAMPEP_0175964106 /NCGR_PEP_ID=MMETSP0108-20121206/37383_1 /TAXON_ID=195067 ORGANISM="Goniomonas pacifica, Strain CCMP1869" /NCGR_SAMPLE_ID=MMETSP0108 /ASSEMBLY_ACC=CAM_ASM_000204 /LENGTH=90 /DNA_ID=CAMNT_0017292063 /DNA_START=220 /DNA_END=490 /DNA_ORIENTATION=+
MANTKLHFGSATSPLASPDPRWHQGGLISVMQTGRQEATVVGHGNDSDDKEYGNRERRRVAETVPGVLERDPTSAPPGTCDGLVGLTQLG